MEHLRAAKSGSNYHFHRAIRKYGAENFMWVEIDNCSTPEGLVALEVFYIKFFNSMNAGWNMTAGGDGIRGFSHSEETKKKMSGENHPFFGKKRPDMSKKMSGENNYMFGKRGEKCPNFGRHYSEETRKLMSEKRAGEKHPMFGKHLSEETKQKISEKKKGRNNPMYGKTGELHPRFGRHHSEETKRKIIETRKLNRKNKMEATK
jgi:hypothetical protein